MRIKVILIDPANRVIEERFPLPELEAYYSLLNCQTMDTVVLANGDVCYVDDEGLYQKNHFFQLDECSQPLAGRGLIVGSLYTDEGTLDTHARSTLEQIKQKVKFLEDGTFTRPEPVFSVFDWAGLE